MRKRRWTVWTRCWEAARRTQTALHLDHTESEVSPERVADQVLRPGQLDSGTPKDHLASQTHLARVGLSGLEPLTSALSGQRSNRLSYRPARGMCSWARSSRLAHRPRRLNSLVRLRPANEAARRRRRGPHASPERWGSSRTDRHDGERCESWAPTPATADPPGSPRQADPRDRRSFVPTPRRGLNWLDLGGEKVFRLPTLLGRRRRYCRRSAHGTSMSEAVDVPERQDPCNPDPLPVVPAGALARHRRHRGAWSRPPGSRKDDQFRGADLRRATSTASATGTVCPSGSTIERVLDSATTICQPEGSRSSAMSSAVNISPGTCGRK